jgi:hypothetical protein
MATEGSCGRSKEMEDDVERLLGTILLCEAERDGVV